MILATLWVRLSIQVQGGLQLFLATPSVDGSQGVLPWAQVRDMVILPENIRNRLQQQRGFGRF